VNVLRMMTRDGLRDGVIAAAVTAMAATAALAGAGTAAASGPRAAAAAGTISAIAGGIGGPGKATDIAMPFGDACGMTYGAGALYGANTAGLLNDKVVQKIDPVTDELTTVAGDGSAAPYRGNGGPAASASLSASGVALDHSGNLVISDLVDSRIRVVAAQTGTFYGKPMTAGHIYSVAGNGTAGFSGDGGPATKAEINRPDGLVVDAAGNVLIADNGNNRLRALAGATGTFYGQPMTAGHIYTIAGNGTGGFRGDGGPGVKAELLDSVGLTLDAAGNVLIADAGNNRIRVLAGQAGTFYGQPMTANDIYTIAGSKVHRFIGDGGPATAAGLWIPSGVAVDAAGNVLIADSLHYRVRVVAGATGTFYGQPMVAGDIYTIAGNGQRTLSRLGLPATSSAIGLPSCVTVDGAGNVVIGVRGTRPFLVVAATAGRFYRQSMTAGDLYAIAGNNQPTSGFGGPATQAVLGHPFSVATDGSGNDLISAAGRILVLPHTSGTFYGQPMTAGNLYVIAGNGQNGFSGDGGPAAGAALSAPYGMVTDAAGNIVIGDTFNFRIRVIAEQTGTFYGQPMIAGDIYTIAGDGKSGLSGDGGLATAAKISFPSNALADTSGNVLIADRDNDRIRVVAEQTGTFYGRPMTADHIYTIAGSTTGFAGNGGPATRARLDAPFWVTVDPAGDVLIADNGNAEIREVPEASG
jgi:trimeric autotransporter adhesin